MGHLLCHVLNFFLCGRNLSLNRLLSAWLPRFLFLDDFNPRFCGRSLLLSLLLTSRGLRIVYYEVYYKSGLRILFAGTNRLLRISRLQPRSFPVMVLGVVSVVMLRITYTVQSQNLRSHTIEKVAIMANRDNRSFISGESFLERFA